MTQSAEANGGFMSRLGNVGKWLSHPIVLLLVGALISALLIPFITRRWLETKEELDFRAELAAEITEKATGFAMAVQGFHMDEAARERAETPELAEADLSARIDALNALNDEYQQWAVDSAVIASRLSAYFPDEDLADDWRAYASLVDDFYALEDKRVDAQGSQVQAILDRLEASGERLDEVQAEKEALRQLGLPVEGWLALRAEVFGRRDAIVRRVLDAEIDTF